MDNASLLALTHNAALLLAIIFIYDLTINRKRLERVLWWKLVIGLGLGTTAILIMLTPWEFAPGIWFDTRSVLLSIAGLFFGFIPTLIAITMAATLRLYQGGGAELTGTAVIIASGAIGIIWRHYRQQILVGISVGELYLFGLTVHLTMLALMFTLPLKVALEVVTAVSLPVLIVYPLASVLLGVLFTSRLHRKHLAEALAKNELVLRAKEEQLTLAFAGGGLGFWDWDIVNGTVERNARWAEMLGYTYEEIQHTIKQWVDFIHPDDREAAWNSLEQHLQGKTPQHKIEYRMLTKNGGYCWILDCARVVSYSSDGKPLRMCGTHTDITERKQAEESMRLASMVYENTSEAMMVTDANGMIITINPAFTELTQYTPDEIIHQDSFLLRVNSSTNPTYKALRHTLKTTGTWLGETLCKRKDGEEFVIWLAINTIFDNDGKPYRRVALFSDMTDKKNSEEVIWRHANFDQLTQLPNRRMFLDHLSQEIKKSARSQQLLALLFLDLDLFKEVNDTLGHDIGDMLLKETASRLRGCVRETDIVARLGGDEFTVILTDIGNTDAIEHIAEKILTSLAEPFFLGIETAYISTSIGITLYPNDATQIDALLKNADQAMYAAKNLGRNRFNYFTASMQEAAKNRMHLINDLRGALGGDQFFLCYQPIIDLRNGAITKAEALIRWQHPQRGLVGPDEFISVAEDTGMIIDIGNWVFREALQQMAHWRDFYKVDIQISLNKSPIQFRDDDNNLSEWFDVIRQLRLPGSCVTIEITEGLLLDANATVYQKLLAFRDAGIQVSLDDFGTGYSSLAYLKKFDIDYLKIDKSFIRNLAENSDEFALCEAIIVMAHKLGIKVVAEGVETEQQCHLLAAAGCDYAQGYLFSKPVLADEFARLFLAQ